jgi:hypothetical protein
MATLDKWAMELLALQPLAGAGVVRIGKLCLLLAWVALELW